MSRHRRWQPLVRDAAAVAAAADAAAAAAGTAAAAAGPFRVYWGLVSDVCL